MAIVRVYLNTAAILTSDAVLSAQLALNARETKYAVTKNVGIRAQILVVATHSVKLSTIYQCARALQDTMGIHLYLVTLFKV